MVSRPGLSWRPSGVGGGENISAADLEPDLGRPGEIGEFAWPSKKEAMVGLWGIAVRNLLVMRAVHAAGFQLRDCRQGVSQTTGLNLIANEDL